MHYLKQAPTLDATTDIETVERVRQLLRDIERDGEDAVRRLNRELDGWEGDLLLSRSQLEASAQQLTQSVRNDLRFAHERVRDFAIRQRDSMTEFEAALARPQIAMLDERGRHWNQLYAELTSRLSGIDYVRVPARESKEGYIGSSLQFSIVGLGANRIERFVEHCAARGVGIKWFGRSDPLGFTSNFEHWGYAGNAHTLQRTREVLSGLCDMRIPLSLTREECALIAAIIADSVRAAAADLLTESTA